MEIVQGGISFWLLGKNHTCVEINTDFHNFHVCGKNQTCVGITNDYLNYHVCGFYHTCVDFTKYLRHVKVFGKNHTCVGKYKHVCVFQNTGWYNLNGLTYNRNKNTCRILMRFVNIEGAGSRYFQIGTTPKEPLYFTCVGIPTHIKQQNNNNNIKEITLHMSSPPKIWGKSLHFQG